MLIIYISGVNRFADDLQHMLGFRPGLYWMICWAGISPIFLIVSLIFLLIIIEFSTLDCLRDGTLKN